MKSKPELYIKHELFKLTDNDNVIFAESATHDECWEIIKNYAKERNLGYYYRGNLLENGTQWIDYGSHTHFFLMKSERLDDEVETDEEFLKNELDFAAAYEVLHDGTACDDEEKKENLDKLFKNYDEHYEPKLEKDKIEPIKLNVTGIENVAKIIEALTEKNGLYEFRVWTDEYQAYQKTEQRSYTIEIADRQEAQKFVFDSEYNW